MPFDSVTQSELFFAPGLLKAMPAEESGRRFVYFEASNEHPDYENEIVLQKALAESADYYLRYGNIDLDHLTQIGPNRGLTDFMAYEIGRPVQVKADGKKTFVKGEIFAGDAPVAENANRFWDSLTKLQPPQRWYPSVAGTIEDRRQEVRDGERRGVIHGVRWTNVGMSKTPVNLRVPVSTHAPFGPLTKSLDAYAPVLLRALEAGYGTDEATLEGGGALRKQSGTRRITNYFDFRDRISTDLRAGRVHPTAALIVAHAAKNYGIDESDAADFTARFLDDLDRGLTRRQH